MDIFGHILEKGTTDSIRLLIEQCDNGDLESIKYIENVLMEQFLRNIVFTDSELDFYVNRSYIYPFSTWFLGYLYTCNIYGVTKDNELAYKLVNWACTNGCKRANITIAWIHKENKNYAEAFKIYESISETDPNAICNLGIMYEFGQSVTQNYGKAIELYELSKSKGCAYANLYLAYMYKSGRGMYIDYMKAIELFEIAGKAGICDAICNLALMYKCGHGVKQDYIKAIELLEITSSGDSFDSFYHLAEIYRHVYRDYVKAAGLYKKAFVPYSDKSNDTVTYKLKSMYLDIFRTASPENALQILMEINDLIRTRNYIIATIDIILGKLDVISDRTIDRLLKLDLESIYENEQIPLIMLQMRNILSDTIDI